MKRHLAASLGLLVLAGALSSSALAAAPSGPRLAFVEWTFAKKAGSTRLASVGPSGEKRRTSLEWSLGEPGLEVGSGGISWLADGSRVAIDGTRRPLPKRRAKGRSQRWIYMVDPATDRARRLPGTRGGSNPVVSPDGSQIAFTRSVFRIHFDPNDLASIRMYGSASTWIVARAGGKPRQLTPWRNGLSEEPSSFSPDGAVLALTRTLRRKPPEAVAYRLDTGTTKLIAAEAEEPVYSPDGSRIALVSYRDGIVVQGDEESAAVPELYLVDPDGSDPLRLTHSKGSEESEPSWDPSGQRLAFVRSGPGVDFGFLTDWVMEINADGRCARVLVGKPKPRSSPEALFTPSFFSPAWQPGPGREAGPIPC